MEEGAPNKDRLPKIIHLGLVLIYNIVRPKMPFQTSFLRIHTAHTHPAILPPLHIPARLTTVLLGSQNSCSWQPKET